MNISKYSNTLFHLPLAFPSLAASTAIMGSTLITAGSTFKIFEIFETCVKERSLVPEKERKILNIGKALRNGALATAVSIALLCLYTPPLSLSLSVASACFTSMVVIAVLAARVFMQKRTFSSFSLKQGTGTIPNSPLEQRDTQKLIIETFTKPLLSTLGPIEKFRQLHSFCLLNKSFHTTCRALQAEILDDHFDSIPSNVFLSSFDCVLSFVKQYRVKKLNFEGYLSVNQYQQLIRESPFLTHLRLEKSGALTSSVPQSLKSLSHLKHLELNGDISAALLEDVVQLKALESLILDRNDADITKAPPSIDSHLAKISQNLQQLQALKIRGWEIFSNVGFEEICKMKNLAQLSITVRNIETDSWNKLAALENLLSLNLASINAIDPLKAIGKHLTKLESLDLFLHNLLDEDLVHLKNLVNLHHLRLFSCPQITGTFLSTLAGHLNELRSLTLEDLSPFTEEGFQNLFRFKKLEKLEIDLYAVKWVKGQHLSKIAQELPDLRTLTLVISFNPWSNASEEQAFKNEYPHLRVSLLN